jgi:hypothetical protein
MNKAQRELPFPGPWVMIQLGTCQQRGVVMIRHAWLCNKNIVSVQQGEENRRESFQEHIARPIVVYHPTKDDEPKGAETIQIDKIKQLK